ncbi:MAG: hypothetical protein C4539_02180 [Ignavibacteriales bacterium]|nr:MAG: hypothetical protein C4539_02180 [Ignavibacteriales bacterium]
MSKRDDKNKRLFNLLDGDDSRIEKILSSYEKQIIAEYKKALQAFKIQLDHIYERFGEKPA